jgi:hypothetical protein
VRKHAYWEENAGALLVDSKDHDLEARFDVEKAKCMFVSREQNADQNHNIEVKLKVQISGATLMCQKIAFVKKLTAD